MIHTIEIIKNLKVLEVIAGRRILFEDEDIKIIHKSSCLEMECLGEKDVSKRDLSLLALFFKKYYELTRNNKVLILLSKTWRLNSGAWNLITKLGFFGKFTVAFVSTELHQNLLLKNLEKLEFNLKSFKNKENAEEWLSTQNLKKDNGVALMP